MTMRIDALYGPRVRVALFKAGDFGKPALTHAHQVPGTADMTRLKERITYQYEETAGGGRVRIVTHNAEALAAVHAFLHFQIEDHRTGDSGLVQKPTAPGCHGMAAMHKAMMKNGGMVRRGLHGGAMETAPQGKTTPTRRNSRGLLA
jgi:hypothetical protein